MVNPLHGWKIIVADEQNGWPSESGFVHFWICKKISRSIMGIVVTL